MTKEKEEKSELEKCIVRRKIVAAIGLCVLMLGAIFALTVIGAAQTFFDLRSDDYMNDPSIPYNERDNASYTFTDEWLSDRYNTLIWWAVPGLLMIAIAYVILISSDIVMDDKQVHKAYCKKWEDGDNPNEPKLGFKYCPSCGLKLSRLEKK